MRIKKKSRSGLIRWQLQQLTLPRLQMSVILLLTGAVGFISSFLLLHTGVIWMWVRYPLAILSAYIGFLLLLSLWLAIHRHSGNFDFDLPGIDNNYSGGTTSQSTNFSFGGGRDFAGGGAGGSWGGDISSSIASGGGDSSSVFEGFSFDLDLEEIGFIILAAAALLAGLVASLYVIYIAPILLAEILVDGLLLGGLYKSVKNIERKYWLETAVRKTLIPTLLCVLFFGIAGWALQAIAPQATSIGEVWRSLTTAIPIN